MSCLQLNSKNNVQVCYLRLYYDILFATDGKNRNGLKHEIVWPTFSSFGAILTKILKNSYNRLFFFKTFY